MGTRTRERAKKSNVYTKWERIKRNKSSSKNYKEHLFLTCPLRNNMFRSRVRLGNQTFSLASHEYFVPIQYQNLFQFSIKGTCRLGTVVPRVCKSEHSKIRYWNNRQN